MGCYYIFHLRYPKTICTLLSVIQTEVVGDTLHDGDVTPSYKKAIGEWKEGLLRMNRFHMSNFLFLSLPLSPYSLPLTFSLSSLSLPLFLSHPSFCHPLPPTSLFVSQPPLNSLSLFLSVHSPSFSIFHLFTLSNSFYLSVPSLFPSPFSLPPSSLSFYFSAFSSPSSFSISPPLALYLSLTLPLISLPPFLSHSSSPSLIEHHGDFYFIFVVCNMFAAQA
ncbi:hypothetical protein AALO_G00202190 [Alosa alosa]|uniref:Uncharacterized protein n=1 Tax=Alosa alosa TaxID=278164 RepID=A0AAV6G7A9_9TELE|nr:hypothetical protein AALO_G00202190 [Alosa alosa]